MTRMARDESRYGRGHGLSGCSYEEGVSWGKFVPRSEAGRFAEVFADASIAWPLLVRAVMERVDA